ncbi:MAG: hypothetical protein J0H82_04635 [Alphaproteobacteria bacterium]|jgi:hypothetical protein|nr:hypothetical protein [Alphaproteobacteria bacterium]
MATNINYRASADRAFAAADSMRPDLLDRSIYAQREGLRMAARTFSDIADGRLRDLGETDALTRQAEVCIEHHGCLVREG